MEIPEKLIQGQIEEGKIYFFYDSIPEGSDLIPKHFHICLKIHEEIVYLLCCTTQEQTIDNYIRLNGLDWKTKVFIAPSAFNGLTKDTFLNCNSIKSSDFEELVKLYEKGGISFSGEVTTDEFNTIKVGILSSAVVEPYIKKLFLPQPSKAEE